jgi:4-diphosphocytidyl-2-C-methyl-D-erythritol kinase
MTFDNKTPSFTPPLEWISLRVPAKLNIYLQAGVLREDGYHDLTTVYQAIDLYDELKVILAQPGAGLTMTVSGSEGEGNKIPIDSQNLVIKAAGVLASKFKLEPALQFELVKRIPTEAGLGGGSADAAAALVACNAIWALGLTDEGLSARGALVGEDVPFFIKGMMAIGVGHKQPLICLPTNTWTWYWVVGIHKVGLSTKDVFAAFDKLISSNRDEQQQEYQRRRLRCLEIPWSTTPPALLANYLSNDLEQAAIMLLP